MSAFGVKHARRVFRYRLSFPVGVGDAGCPNLKAEWCGCFYTPRGYAIYRHPAGFRCDWANECRY